MSMSVAETAGTHTASADAAGERPAHRVSKRAVPVRVPDAAAAEEGITDGVGIVGVIGLVATAGLGFLVCEFIGKQLSARGVPEIPASTSIKD